jgi:hypothetical protein
MLDICDLVNQIEATVQRHNLGRTGVYGRWLWQNAAGNRELGPNEYGCSDAANILYTIGRFPRETGERAAWIATLQELQNPLTGLFHEKTHTPFHTTAHCIAALELFDAGPRHPLKEMARIATRAELEAFLESLDWTNPWSESHKGAGLYAARVLAGETSVEWTDWYFAWLWENVDAQTGLLRKGYVDNPDEAGLFPHLAGTFHYLFNQEYARRPLRYPGPMIDTCLRISREKSYPILGWEVNFAEVDWVYCLARALRQSGHRFEEATGALRQFGTDYVRYLQGLDHAKDEGWNDLHALFGATCALAELQQSLPGFLTTERPLKLVLDRRPFI